MSERERKSKQPSVSGCTARKPDVFHQLLLDEEAESRVGPIHTHVPRLNKNQNSEPAQSPFKDGQNYQR